LGTDQVLECNGQIFNKPNSLPIVRSQLSQLSGQRHRLVNGLVMVKGSKVQWSHTAFATLKMRKLSDTFLDDYIKQIDDNMLSSVGGYQLESRGSQLFEYIDGDYFTILGLPLLPLLAYLRQIHILLD
jgi:septum formation protein